MHEAWNRILAWCERYAPEVLAGLNPGESEAAIQAAEAHLGVAFSDDLRELYRLHDGESDEDGRWRGVGERDVNATSSPISVSAG